MMHPKDDATPLASGAGVNGPNGSPQSMQLPLTPPPGVPAWAWAKVARADRARWAIPERDATGEVIGTAYRDGGGGKTFAPGGRRGLIVAWPLDPYAGSSAADPVFVMEGASDAAALLGLGLDAVGVPMAGYCGAMLAELLAGRHVVLVVDADDAGRRGGQKIARALVHRCASVRVIEPPGEAKDAREAVIAGADRAAFLALAVAATAIEPAPIEAQSESARSSRLRTVRLADVEPEALRWLWPGRIPLGKLTLLYGDPGLGKSFLTVDIASRVSTGNGWPDIRGERFEPGSVILLTAEDGLADTVRPRLDAAGADCTRIEAIESVGTPGGRERALNLADDLRLIEERIAERDDVRLFIIDPISAYCGNADSHTNAEVRGMLAPIAKLAERHGVAIVAVSHLNKGAGGRAMYRAMGSLAFIAAARAGWLVVEDESDPAKRLMLPTKMNLAAKPTGMAFALHDGGAPGGVPSVAWSAEPVDLSADDALEAIAGHGDDERKGALTEAVDFLRHELGNGAKPSSDVKRAAKAAGIAPRTLDRARAELGVIAAPDGFGGPWTWALPSPECAAFASVRHTTALAHTGNLGELCGSGDGWGEL